MKFLNFFKNILFEKFWSDKEFAKNVFVLASGNFISHLIQFFSNIFLAKIYDPKSFGIFSFFISLVSILTVLSTGQYEFAINLPKKDKDAFSILKLIIKISIFIFLLFYVFIIFFFQKIEKIFNLKNLAPLIYLIPISVLARSICNSIQYWFNRQSLYLEISKNKINQSLFVFGASFFLFFLGRSGLIVGSTLGCVVSCVHIIYKLIIKNGDLIRRSYFSSEIKQAKIYKAHPFCLMPSQIIGVLSQNMPIFIVYHFLQLSCSGYFSLAYQAVTVPTALIASAIGDVFRQKASDLYRSQGNFKEFYLETLVKSFLISIIIFFIVFYILPFLFLYLFGQKWKIAGDYAQLLSISSFFQFIAITVDKVFVILKKMKYEFFAHIYRLFIMISVFFIFVPEKTTDRQIVIFITLSLSSFYIIIIIISCLCVFYEKSNSIAEAR